MVILGTPQISFGLNWIEWLIVVGTLMLLFGIYWFYRRFRRKKLENLNYHDPVEEEQRTEQSGDGGSNTASH